MAGQIESRKYEHIDICLTKNVEFQNQSAGFDRVKLQHCALPELDFDTIDTSVFFLNKKLESPLMITAITGGYDGAEKWNQLLATACQATGIGLGIGSFRQALHNSCYRQSFQIARETAVDIPVIANIGAAQTTDPDLRKKIIEFTRQLQFDALAIHLNPLQEILQPEGSRSFVGLLNGIAELIQHVNFPVLVKETGAGISAEVAGRLAEIGVTGIDISGAGGTSWAAVEAYRGAKPHLDEFREWGIPTVSCLEQLLAKPLNIPIIASGGVRSGIDAAKACVLGAQLAGAALPFLRVLHDKGVSGLIDRINEWKEQFRVVCLLTGATNVSALRKISYQIEKKY